MASAPSVRWNEKSGRWMAWVRFRDGSRKKVERVNKVDAQRDLDALLAQRELEGVPSQRDRAATFEHVITAWFAADCANVSPNRRTRHATKKSANTIANARQLLGTSVIPVIGKLRVDRTTTQKLEAVFNTMSDRGYATSTIDRNWNYLNQACEYGLRYRMIQTNPAANVLLPPVKPF